jgi:hypothetical protein
MIHPALAKGGSHLDLRDLRGTQKLISPNFLG